MDGLFLVDALATRMKELDALLLCPSSSVSSSLKKKKKKGSNKLNNNNNCSNFYQLMTTRDKESGYTPLHYSILQRDLMTVLLLLKHASMPTLNRDVVVSSLLEEQQQQQLDGDATFGGFNAHVNGSNSYTHTSSSLSLHPLRLLDGNLHNNDDSNAHNDEESNPYNLINDLMSTTDNEGLTPLQLLGKSSCAGLEHCRRSLTWRALSDGWMEQRHRQQ